MSAPARRMARKAKTRARGSAPSATSDRRRWLAPAVMALTFLAYVPSLAYEFVSDDKNQIARNIQLQSWEFVPRYFTGHVWAQMADYSARYYRPLFMLWLRFNHAFFGTEPWGWHFSTVLAHVAATGLLFLLVRRLTGESAVALPAALIFGLHPVHLESVAWVSGVTDPLMFLAILGSLLCYLRWQQNPRGTWLALSALLYLAALLVKETALATLPLLLLLAWRKRQEVSFAAALLPFGCVSLFYLGLRLWALHGLGVPQQSIPLRQMLLTWPMMVGHYLKHLLLPVGLSGFYPSNVLSATTLPGFWIPLAVVVAALAAVWFLVRKLEPGAERDTGVFAAVLSVAPLLLALNLNRLDRDNFLHDRYLYLTSAGFAILLALALRRLATPRLNAVAVIIIALLLGGLTVAQESIWTDNVSLYRRATETVPQRGVYRRLLADNLAMRGRCGEAIPVYEQVVASDPANWTALSNLGQCYLLLGDIEAGERYLERAAATGNDPKAWQDLQQLREQLRRKEMPGR
jgi:tetratricopeptide (TPR) repeat protein